MKWFWLVLLLAATSALRAQDTSGVDFTPMNAPAPAPGAAAKAAAKAAARPTGVATVAPAATPSAAQAASPAALSQAGAATAARGVTATGAATSAPGGPTATGAATSAPGGPTATGAATSAPGGPTATGAATSAPGGPTQASATAAARGASAKAALAAPAKAAPAKAAPPLASRWTVFVEGMAGGVAAFFMPCIFPMLPLTVSFFTKGASKGKGVRRAAVYGLSIVGIYVALGLAVTAIFGADALNNLSTNGLFNFFFFLLLVAFAASFLGGFEITLPSSWVNKMDAGAGRGGMAGIFFMAGTLALVSFSCTGPIIGTLLVQTATTGALLGPAVGMLGFSLALALPFTLFALFPTWLARLPRSGGWLNSVKVVLGFLELALSLKFLSNVDLAYHWRWFDREVFLVLWIVIFALMGFYILGKIRLGHDDAPAALSVPRLFLSIVILAFTMYMIPGLWGAPLKSISALLPPMATQDFDLSALSAGLPGAAVYGAAGANGVTSGAAASGGAAAPHKYASLFDRPHGFDPYFDYAEALAAARAAHKPMLIDFTGHACVNCRKMEANVWTDATVAQRINTSFVVLQLYVDDKTDLDTTENTPDGRVLRTLGNKWSFLQTSKFGANSQPYYVLLDPATEEPLVAPQGANFDPRAYLGYLDSGLAVYRPQ
ncbi:protein-disulfide reductase DsbD family protein [Dinghuibacter silviterrae]|uniref:Thiol:disulfide interchange protein DsbD n=1 Tax=Dinghuibacter silviterrae TaxID=1539049 RepID=A0A4R8DHR4_9BACT|nr:thioredoxin family protein [Dinghuibacter silviterrae]TDW97269.1 thiol:disulfide interchange protein DsbD [Dinghuibacter silviterrae]